MTGDPTVVARYFERTEADLAMARLEGAGIPVWLLDENMTRIAWLYNIALGGARLVVPEERLAEARELLEAPAEVDQIDPQAPDDPESPDGCPACKVGTIGYTLDDRRKRAASLLLLWLGIPILLWGKRLRCDSCGAVWRLARSRAAAGVGPGSAADGARPDATPRVQSEGGLEDSTIRHDRRP